MTLGAVSDQLPRRLSLLGLWLLMINGMVGAGIFGLPGTAARLAGPASPCVFLLCAAALLPIVLCFVQLSRLSDETGGPVAYANLAFGPLAGFLAGWALYVGRVTAFAANLALVAEAVAQFWDAAAVPVFRQALLLATTVALLICNIRGTRPAVHTLGLLTLLKFFVLIGLVVVGLLHIAVAGTATGAAAAPATWRGVGQAVFLMIYAFLGFESGLVTAGEARNPQRDVAKALLLALAVAAILYASIQAVVVFAVPDLDSTNSRPLLQVARQLLGPWGEIIVACGFIASVSGNLTSSLFAIPRITYRLALDGHLPKVLGRVHPTWQTPAVSIVCFAVFALALALTGTFPWLAGLSVLTRIPVFLLCIGALVKLSPARLARNWPVWLGAFVCFGLLTQVHADDYLAGAALIAAGLALYAVSM